MTWPRIFIVTAFSMLLLACASEPTELVIEEEEWVYEIRAINLVARASADLNSVRGRPHSLALGIFQMNDPNTFRGLSVTQTGAVELLQKGQIDESIVNFEQITIRPGEQKNVAKQHPERTEKLLAALKAWQADVAAGATPQPDKP